MKSCVFFKKKPCLLFLQTLLTFLATGFMSPDGWRPCGATLGAPFTCPPVQLQYIAVPPRIVACSPKSLHHRQGETIELFCNASGSPEPSLTWNKDGKLLHSSSRIRIEGYKVIIRNVHRSDAGVYMGTFANSVGSVSQLINLVVEGAAYIMVPPENMTAIEGQRIKFQCGAMAYPSNITYNWFKDNENIKFLPDYGDRINAFKDGSLVITSVIKNDMGWYTCHPTNGIGEDPKASAYLNVTYLPKMLHMPNRLYWALGHQQSLVCNIDANPPVVDTFWTKNGHKLHFTSNRLRLLANGTVVVSHVENTDAGSYSCRPVSSLGSGPSSPLVQIIVRDPPYFTIRPKSIYQAEAGQSVTIPCEAEGTPKPVITWRRVNGEIIWDSRVVKNKGNLTIYKLTKEDHGDYECVATNQITSIVIGTRLIIEISANVPSPAFFITRLRQEGSQVRHKIPEEGRRVHRLKRCTDNNEDEDNSPNNGNGCCRLDVEILDEAAYTSHSNNNLGKKTTPHAPYNVTVVTSLFTAKVEWMPAYDGGLEQSYVIWFRCTNSAEPNWQTIRVPPGDKTSFIVYSLEADTVYEFMVLARNSLGDGLYSDHVFAKTLGYHDDLPTGLPTKPNGATYIPPVVRPIGPRPKPPVNVTVKLLHGAVNITWSAPEKSNISIFYYVIEYCNSTIWRRLEDVVLTPKTWFVMRDLRTGTYKYRVFSFSLLSYSQPQESEEILVPEGPENEDDDSGHPDANFSTLPVPAIGGIVGGLAFLLIAVILAIIAVIISKRKQRKKAKKYGNVKYFEPDQVDSSRNETSSEWNYGNQDGRRNIVKPNEPTGTLHQTFVTPCRSPSDRLNCDPVPPSLPSRPHSPPSLLRPYIEQDQRTIPHSGYLKHSPFNNGAKVRPLDRHSDFKPQGTLVQHCPVRNMVHSTRRQLPSPGPLSPIGPGITHTNNIHTPVSPHLLHPHSPLNLHISRAQIYRPHNHGIPDGRQSHYRPTPGTVTPATALDSHSPGTLRSRTASPLRTTTSPVRSIAVAYPRGMPRHPTSPHLSSKASYPKTSEFSPSSPQMSMNKTYLTSSPDDTTGLYPFQISDISSVQPSSFSERSRDRGFSSFSSPQGGLPINLSEHEPRYTKRAVRKTEDDEEFGYRGSVPFRIRSIHPQQRNTISSHPREGGGSHHTPKYPHPGNRRSPNRHHNYEAQAQQQPPPPPPPPPPPSSPPAHNHPNHYHPNHHHHHHYNHLHSSVDPLEGGESSDSSNQPFGYTRERFQKTVECVRQVPVHRPSPDEAAGPPYHFQAPESQPPYRSLQCNDNNSRKVPPSHSFYSPRDSLSASGSGHYPAHYCRSKLHFTNSKGHPREGPQEESHTSMSSSGRGSILGRSHYLDVGGRASIKVDTLPDSYSSGLGSRSTSHSVPSSSCGQLRAGPPMEITSASSLTLPHEYDVSIDSSPFLDASTRRDLSGDENYEFDSLNTHDAQEVVGPSFIGPRASAGHPYSTPDMVSPPELLLNAKDLYYSLYPKSRKPSRYSNSEKRFERLREEYYEYRRRQLLHSKPQVLISMDSEML